MKAYKTCLNLLTTYYLNAAYAWLGRVKNVSFKATYRHTDTHKNNWDRKSAQFYNEHTYLDWFHSVKKSFLLRSLPLGSEYLHNYFNIQVCPSIQQRPSIIGDPSHYQVSSYSMFHMPSQTAAERGIAKLQTIKLYPCLSQPNPSAYPYVCIFCYFLTNHLPMVIFLQ